MPGRGGAPLGPSPLMSLPGAVATPTGTGDGGAPGAHPADAEIAWHYGDPLGEQRAAERGPILLDRWGAGEVTVTGESRLSWLHSLCTQHLEGLADGDATEALWLSPRGQVEHWADVVESGGATTLRTEPGGAAALAEFLLSMRFWARAEPVETTGEAACVTIAGRGAADAVAAALGVAVPPAGHAARVTGGLAAGGSLRSHPDRVDVIVPRPAFAAVAGELIHGGARPAGSWAASALRVPARRPRFGVDNDERTIPNEMPWLATAVHLHKGCYRGQETVARVENLGQPPRRLALLHLDGSAGPLPATGDPVLSDQGRTVGRIGTVAQHWEAGPVALALVKRSVGPGVALVAGGVDAAMDPDDAVAAARPSSVDRGALYDFRRR